MHPSRLLGRRPLAPPRSRWLVTQESRGSTAKQSGDAGGPCQSLLGTNRQVQSFTERVCYRYRRSGSCDCARDGGRTEAREMARSPPRDPGRLEGQHRHGWHSDHCGKRAVQGTEPTEDAEVVRRLRNAGAVVLGKLNLHEFAYGATSAVSYFGAVHNPWALDRVPGGSSGGAAAAVAADLCFAALGTDTAGSVRIPACCCGVVGLRPPTAA